MDTIHLANVPGKSWNIVKSHEEATYTLRLYRDTIAFFPIAGTQYSGYTFTGTVPVTVQHEPSNPYSDNAYVVLDRDTKIGYIPEPLAQKLHASEIKLPSKLVLLLDVDKGYLLAVDAQVS